jgi:hypothetical protein
VDDPGEGLGDQDGPVWSLEAAATARLEALGVIEEPEAVAVVLLARSIDVGTHSGASMAALVREFRAALQDACAGAPAAGAAGASGDQGDGIQWEVG